MNEIQVAQRNLKATMLEDGLFGTASSAGHCIFTEFFMGAGIAKQFDQLYPQMKREASKNLNPGSVFCFKRPVFKMMHMQFYHETQIFPQTIL